MKEQAVLKEIVSVTEMARLCRLSRARFYQLIGENIFPKPSRNPETKRPFFNRKQQEQCLLIRRMNRGANGKPVIFYGCRLEKSRTPQKRKRLPISKTRSDQNREDPIICELRLGLAQLGMSSLEDADIRRALSQLYPDGYRSVDSAQLLRAIFEELQCRNSQDKLSG